MALRLIRRHLKDCPHTSTRYRRCQCPIHVYGTLGGQTIRRALDQTSWEAATELILGWTASGEIGVVKAEAPSVRDAITKFLADLNARHLGWEAKRKYRHLLEDRLLSWCESRGLSNLRQLTVDALRQFRQSWKDSPLYATKNLERLRAFLRFCQQAGWIKQNPATSVKPPKVTASPTLPFSRDEMKRIVDACDEYGGNKDRIRAFVLVMRFTGLRIGDAIRLSKSQVSNGTVFVRTAKTGQAVTVPVPPQVVKALEKADSGSERYFWTGANIRSAVSNWSRYLGRVFVLFVLGEKERWRRDKPPVETLQAFEACLKKTYTEKDQVTVGRRSVTVEFEKAYYPEEHDGKVLSIDAVPAFASGKDEYEIPDKDTGKWIKTNPETHKAQSTAKNKALSERFVPLVKMAKGWNRANGKPIKPSFLVEVMAQGLVDPPFSNFPDEIRNLFAAMEAGIAASWPDPAGLGPPVSDQMTPKLVTAAKAALQDAQRKVALARRAEESGRQGEALRLWREILGDYFPLS